MSVIDGVGRPGLPRAGQRTAGAGAAGFSVPLASAAAASRSGEVASASAAALDGMLALQEHGGETVQDRAARRRGQDLLALLARLQAAIVAGEAEPELLQDLTDLAADPPVASGAELRRVLGAIVLRVRVELVRRGCQRQD